MEDLQIKRVRVRFRNEVIEVDRDRVQYVDVSPKQLVSVVCNDTILRA